MKITKSKLLLGMALACLPAFAQGTWEVSPFVGYMYGGSFDVTSDVANALGIYKLNMKSSLSYGVSTGVNLGEVMGFEFLWNHQPTQVAGKLRQGGEYPTKYDVNNNQYHGNILFHFAPKDSKFRPYALVGFGATNSSGNNDSVTKFSYGLGGGLKYFFTENIGVRVQARYAPTYLYTSAGGLWCNWWGYCWVVGNDHYMNQGDVTIGLNFRF
jgi:opacity protein-like surface antigen